MTNVTRFVNRIKDFLNNKDVGEVFFKLENFIKTISTDYLITETKVMFAEHMEKVDIIVTYNIGGIKYTSFFEKEIKNGMPKL